MKTTHTNSYRTSGSLPGAGAHVEIEIAGYDASDRRAGAVAALSALRPLLVALSVEPHVLARIDTSIREIREDQQAEIDAEVEAERPEAEETPAW